MDLFVRTVLALQLSLHAREWKGRLAVLSRVEFPSRTALCMRPWLLRKRLPG